MPWSCSIANDFPIKKQSQILILVIVQMPAVSIVLPVYLSELFCISLFSFSTYISTVLKSFWDDDKFMTWARLHKNILQSYEKFQPSWRQMTNFKNSRQLLNLLTYWCSYLDWGTLFRAGKKVLPPFWKVVYPKKQTGSHKSSPPCTKWW